MGITPYYRDLRDKIGTDLLLLQGVAGVIHNAAGEVLIQKRVDGAFSLPGGAIDPGETPAQAVVREVYEETGLQVRPTHILGILGGQPYRYSYANGDEVEVMVALFTCEVVGGKLEWRDDESADLIYFPPSNLPPLATEYPRHLLVPGCRETYFAWDEAWLVNAP